MDYRCKCRTFGCPPAEPGDLLCWFSGNHDRAPRLVSHESGLGRKPAGVWPGEFLIFIVVRAIGDSEALPMRFGREDGRADIRHPDLNGPQSLPT